MLEEQRELTKPVRIQILPCCEYQNCLGCFGVALPLVAGHPSRVPGRFISSFALRSLLGLMGVE